MRQNDGQNRENEAACDSPSTDSSASLYWIIGNSGMWGISGEPSFGAGELGWSGMNAITEVRIALLASCQLQS